MAYESAAISNGNASRLCLKKSAVPQSYVLYFFVETDKKKRVCVKPKKIKFDKTNSFGLPRFYSSLPFELQWGRVRAFLLFLNSRISWNKKNSSWTFGFLYIDIV